MKKGLIAVLFLALFIKAEEIKIDAKKSYADEANKFIEFTGNVTVVKGEDKLSADNITLYLDEKGRPLKYVASGGVFVKVLLNQKFYNAKGDVLTYETQNQKYTLKGNAFLSEVDTNRKIYGDIIEANQMNGTYSVEGRDLEPAKFIFQIEDIK
ncbi:MAG: lipopolysaccharide transport periplasmic protein LptA [Campylobacteraceae bacterium]|jgi:lipopolysaccharide export system protein LptA|nr:lipopolysaccharide transport periplasmic protein LptA [Campylobacteraceae bacterium]